MSWYGLFGFNMFGALCASCILTVSFRCGKFPAIISSNIFSILPFFFLLLLEFLLHLDWPTLYYPIGLSDCFHFFKIWISVCGADWVVSIILSSMSLICSSALFILSLLPLAQIVSLKMNFLVLFGSSLYFLVPF